MAKLDVTKREAETPAATAGTQDIPVFSPRVDVSETTEAVILVADMPGVDETSVSVDLDKNVLTVAGRFGLHTPEGYTLMYQEYGSGNYERSFTLGNEIDRSGIEAKVKDGVLRLTLPKAQEAQPRRITVMAG